MPSYKTTSFSWRIGFPEGSTVTGCMTNFSNRCESCDASTVSVGAVVVLLVSIII